MIESLTKFVPINFLCTHFGVSRSGYYSWKESSPNKDKHKKKIVAAIKNIFEKSGKTYGSPRVFHALRKQGLKLSKKTVAKYMKEEGLRVTQKKRFTPKTTDSNHSGPIAPRIFKIEEDMPTVPNEIWAGDITYLDLGGVFFYLSVVLDLFNREIVGWSVDDSLKSSGVIRALKHAIISQGTDTKIIFHSDRGSQYASEKFRALLNEEEMIPSMSRKGNCYDNSCVESFFKSLKADLNSMGVTLTEGNVKSEIFKYIEIWYNRKRLHSSLGYLAPEEYRLNYNLKKTA